MMARVHEHGAALRGLTSGFGKTSYGTLTRLSNATRMRSRRAVSPRVTR